MGTIWTKVKLLRIRGRHGRRWVVRWEAGPGRWRQQNVPARFARTSASREAFRAALEDGLNGLGRDAAEHCDLMLEAAVAAFRAAKAAKGLRARSLKSYACILRAFARPPRPRGLADVTSGHVRAFLGRPGLATSTRRRDWVHIKVFFRWCVREEYLAASPVEAVEPPIVRERVPFALEEADILRLLAALAKRPTWAQAAVRLAALSGLRIEELATLGAADVDFQARLVRVPAQKSAEDRWVALDSETAGLLHELRYRGPRMLWGSAESPIVSQETLERRLRDEVRAACAAAGIEAPPKPVQGLRSTFATMAAAAGASELGLAATMGHQSIATTRKFYIAARKARQASEIQRRVAASLEAARAALGDPVGDSPAADEVWPHEESGPGPGASPYDDAG
jgi:integrase